MGWMFHIQYANIVAYMTYEWDVPPPRLKWSELREFLGTFQAQYREKPPLISTDPSWISQVVSISAEQAKRLESLGDRGDNYLDSQIIKDVLAPLKRVIGRYQLYCLPVAGSRDEELQSFLNHIAYSSHHHALVLIPDHYGPSISVLDPFPAIALLTEEAQNWPGVLFWSRRGSAVFCPIRRAYEFYSEFLDASFRSPVAAEGLIEKYKSAYTEQHLRILHLSDLHFGREEVTEKEAYLLGHLDEVAPLAKRVVITGDLCENPDRHHAMGFRNFRASLQRRTGKDPIVIPGNHDQKWMGLTGSHLKELANLEWSNLVIDDDVQCVFFCFDSSKDAHLAQGKVTTKQLLEVATLYQTNSVAKNKIKSYLTLALIHHHPFSFDAAGETIIPRALGMFGLSDEKFLRMEDADGFLSWCAKKNVSIILHGHKHTPRHVTKRIGLGGGQARTITAVGCGSTSGAENSPMSYNLLDWDPRLNRWNISFWEDPGDGSGFVRRFVALHTE